MSSNQPKQTVVGKITSVYGVKGWVKVLSYTEPRENLLSYPQWFITGGADQRVLTLEQGKPHGKGLIAKLVGYDTPEAARVLCGQTVEVDISNLPPLAEGEYYWHQLEGLRIVTVTGIVLGVVDHMMETGANDVLVVRPSPESIDEQERLVPYLPEQVVRKVDLKVGEDWRH
jgi:16S rRNA processing protein RimM